MEEASTSGSDDGALGSEGGGPGEVMAGAGDPDSPERSPDVEAPGGPQATDVFIILLQRRWTTWDCVNESLSWIIGNSFLRSQLCLPLLMVFLAAGVSMYP